MRLLWAYEHDFAAISPFLMKGLAPSAATRADLSGLSRGSPADALGDLRVTVRASPPGTPPRTSYSSCSEHPVRFPGDFAGLSHGAPSISFGAPSVDRMSIAASGDGLHSVWRRGSRCPACLASSRAQFDSATRFSSPGDLPSSTAFSRRRWQSGTPLSCARRLLSSWQRMQSSRSLQPR